jgi:hypothetical protein
MRRFAGTGLAVLAVFTVVVFAGPSQAETPQSLHCSGIGLFSPTNIGTAKGGNAGIVIGDGTGSSEYTAGGNAFTVDGIAVGSGVESHVGEAVSRTTGILKKGQGIVRWPVKSGANHVLSSGDGDIYFKYTGGFTLEPATGIFTGDALFIVVGGTHRFADAKGIVWVDVEVPFALPELPPPGVSPDIPFVYDFNGFIVLKD